ncbi:MAG: hypothetical protein ACON3Z_11555 [Bradymonadia bacterium]
MRWSLLVLLAICLADIVGATPSKHLGELETVRDQGILYLKRGLHKLALERLDRVYRSPVGANDFLTVLSRGRAALARLKVDLAFEMADKSLKLAKTDREKARANRLLEAIKVDYGSVLVTQAKGETKRKGWLKLRNSFRLIKQEKRERYLAVKSRLDAAPVMLPARIFLPHGTYIVNGAEFRISEEVNEPEVAIFLENAEHSNPNSDSTWWWVGTGIATAAIVGIAAIMVLDEPEVRYREYYRLEIE